MKKTAQRQSAPKSLHAGVRQTLQRNMTGWLLLLPSMILFTVIIWRPIVVGILYSFFDLEGFRPVEFVGVDNFLSVMSDSNFIKTLGNTFQYVIWSLIIGFPLPFLTAVMLNEMLSGKQYFKISTYLPGIIPGIAVCLIWKSLYGEGDSGLLNMFLAKLDMEPATWLADKYKVIPLIVIMMSWQGFGGTLIMYLASLQGINQELYEAARLDGAGFFGRFRHILLPHMSGIMLLVLVRQIISVFQVTEQPLIMTDGGPNGASLTLGLTNWRYAFKFGQYERSLALGVVTFVILISLSILYHVMDKKIND